MVSNGSCKNLVSSQGLVGKSIPLATQTPTQDCFTRWVLMPCSLAEWTIWKRHSESKTKRRNGYNSPCTNNLGPSTRSSIISSGIVISSLKGLDLTCSTMILLSKLMLISPLTMRILRLKSLMSICKITHKSMLQITYSCFLEWIFSISMLSKTMKIWTG